MTAADVVRRRLRAQRLVGKRFERVVDAVTWFGAVQAQDYRGALWGIGQRLTHATEEDVEAALVDRSVVRTWPMRGTLHFVAAADVRWMSRLLTPRVIARSRGRHRELELDEKTFARARALLESALSGNPLTRPEAYEVLSRGRVSPAGQRGPHILGRLAMDGVICFGAPRSADGGAKQQTFALLDEWVPRSRVLEGDEALAELAARYFLSHGPATAADLAWWSGLPITSVRRGIEAAGSRIVARGDAWEGSGARAASTKTTSALLLPAYDEYTVGYRDRSAFLDAVDLRRAKNGIFSPVIVLDGRIAGTWTRTTAKAGVALRAALFAAPSRAVRAALEKQAERYGRFVARNAVLTI